MHRRKIRLRCIFLDRIVPRAIFLLGQKQKRHPSTDWNEVLRAVKAFQSLEKERNLQRQFIRPTEHRLRVQPYPQSLANENDILLGEVVDEMVTEKEVFVWEQLLATQPIHTSEDVRQVVQ